MSRRQIAFWGRVLAIVLILGSMLLKQFGMITALMQNFITGVSLCMLGLVMVIENRRSKRSNALMDFGLGLMIMCLGAYLIAQIVMIRLSMV